MTSSARDRAVEAGTTEPAPDRDAVAEAVLRRWAFLSDDESHSTMSLSDAHDLVGVVTRALAEAGTTEPTPDDEWCPDECGHAIEDHEDGGCPFCGCAWPMTAQTEAGAPDPSESNAPGAGAIAAQIVAPALSARLDVYVRNRNVMRGSLVTDVQIDDGVIVDWWTDSNGDNHVAGVEVIGARGVEINGLNLVKGRPHGTGPEWTPRAEVAAPDWTVVRPHVQALLAGIDDDGSQADATVLGGLAGNLIRALGAPAEPTGDTAQEAPDA